MTTLLARIQWQSPQLFWLVVLVLVVMLTAVVWLYRPQVRPLRAPWWWLLLGLRGFALAVLAVSILRPTVLRPLKLEQRAQVAILIDQSASMGVVDSSRTAAQLVELAAGMGELGADARPAALAELRQRVVELRHAVDEIARAVGELEYARLAGRGAESAENRVHEMRKAYSQRVRELSATAPAALTALVAPLSNEPFEPSDLFERATDEHIAQLLERIDSVQAAADEQLYKNSESVRRRCDELAKLSRLELVKRALLGGPDGGGLVARIGLDRPLRVLGFSRELSTLQLPLDDMRADGLETDLTGALRATRQRLTGQRVAAAVVLTDGRQTGADAGTGGNNPAPIWPDVPVIAVVAASPAPRDLSVARVSLPFSAFAGETITVRVEVGACGFDGETADIWLDVGPKGQVPRQTAQVTIADGAARVEMPVKLDQPGPQELTITVAPQSGESTVLNNTVQRVVKVISDPVRVALIGGTATWDYQFLRSALLRSPRFTTIDRLVGKDPNQPDTSIDPAEILQQDAVVLCDVPTEALGAAQWDAIARLVGERGGAAILIVSDPSIAAGYASQPQIAPLLPWHAGSGAQPAWRIWPGEQPMFHVVPAIADLPEMLKLSDDPDMNRARWNELPGIFRFVSVPSPLKRDARVLLAEQDSGAPILTETPSGAGRVLMLGTGEVWRWRNALGEQDHDQDRLWVQLVRYAAQQPYVVHDGNLALDADKLRLQSGEPLRVRARVRNPGSSADPEADAPLVPPTLQLVRSADGSILKSETLVATVPGSTDRFETSFADLQAGTYELHLLVAGEKPIALPIRVGDSLELELRDISPDTAELRRIVGPRGDVLNMADVQSLPQRLKESAVNSEPTYTELRLWDSPYLFLLVLGCLGVEWALRKRVGLP